MPGFFVIDGVAHEAALAPGARPSEPGVVIAAAGDHYWVHLDGAAYELVWQDAVTHYAEEAEAVGENLTRAPMPGVVIAVHVEAGDAVAAGDALMVIESMKLETVVRAQKDGVVDVVHLALGDSFERDAPLVSLRADEEAA